MDIVQARGLRLFSFFPFPETGRKKKRRAWTTMGNADNSRYSAALAMDYGIMVLCTKIHDQANIIHILLVYVCKSHNANLKNPLNASSTTMRY